MLARRGECSSKLLFRSSHPRSLGDRVSASRPPLHASVALDNVLNFLLCDALVLGPVRALLAKKMYTFEVIVARDFILEPNHALEPASIQAQIGISEQLFLHERAEWSSILFDSRILLQIRPVIQRVVIYIINDMLQIETRKSVNQSVLETGLNAKDILHDRGHGALCCVALIDDIKCDALIARSRY